MTNWTFTPTGKADDRQIKVPFFEDAREEIARFYATTKKIATIQEEIIAEVGKLGGGGVQFHEGFFGEKPRRYGYVIDFNINGHPAQMVAAGLPMHSETAAKLDRVRSAAQLASGSAARQGAGALLAQVLAAMLGQRLPGAVSALDLVGRQPPPQYHAGVMYLGALLQVQSVFKKNP